MILTTVLGLLAVGQATLPGDGLSMKQAQEKALIIVVAEPEKYQIIVGTGAAVFGSVDLKHSAVLKGKLDDKSLKSASMNWSGHEAGPEVGTEYIFFLYEYAGHLQIHKVMPRTVANLEAVKREIKP